MAFVPRFGMVTRRERQQADLFYAALTGVRVARSAPVRRSYATYQETPPRPPSPPQPRPPYLPAGGRNFVPQAGTFNCSPTPFTVVPASFLPERTTNADAAIDTALTAAGLSQTQRERIARAGLIPIAADFGARALTELFARLRWSAADIVEWGRAADRVLVQRLLIHIPGHFRELARRAPDAREAFVLECLGWMLMALLRNDVASATGSSWWIPPSPAFVTAVPNPIPAVSADVRALLLRYLLIDTLMTADQWNARFFAWGTSLAGRQWQAEVGAPQPGRPFYASLLTIPAHVSTATPRASFATAWPRRVADVDARHAPHQQARPSSRSRACATQSNSVSVPTAPASPGAGPRRAQPAGTRARLRVPGHARPDLTELPLMVDLHPVYTALFKTIRELGWNDLLYQTSGAGCFRGTKHPLPPG